MYIIGWRMLVKPTWDLFHSLWLWISYFAGIWDSAGITPDSMPREEAKAGSFFEGVGVMLDLSADVSKAFSSRISAFGKRHNATRT